MPEDARDRKGHASEVAVGVPHEDARGEPVVLHQRGRAADEGQHEVEREQVVVMQRTVGPSPDLVRGRVRGRV